MNLKICMPNYHKFVQTETVQSLCALHFYLGTKKQDVEFITPPNTNVHLSRQECVNGALEDNDLDYVLFVDDDMVFSPKHYIGLLMNMQHHDLDFCSCLAFSNSIPTRPCIFGRVPGIEEWGEDPWWQMPTEWPRGEMFEVYASGFGMCMISARMLRGMKEGEPEIYSHFWYPHPMCVNEDIAFCLNARKKGFKLYCDAGLSIGHISKERPLISEELYDANPHAPEYSLNMHPSAITKRDALIVEDESVVRFADS